MRSALVWPVVVGVGMLAACVTIVLVSQQQFHNQMAQLRQEMDRLEGRRAALDTEVLPPQEVGEVQGSLTDTRLLRRIFLDDLREQIASEESEEVAGRLIESWFAAPPAAGSKARTEKPDAAPEGR